MIRLILNVRLLAAEFLAIPAAILGIVRFAIRDSVPLRSHKLHRTAKSTHHPHKIDDQHRECKIGGGAFFAFLLGSDNSHTPPPPKIPPDQEGLWWGWCVVGGPLTTAKKKVRGIDWASISETIQTNCHSQRESAAMPTLTIAVMPLQSPRLATEPRNPETPKVRFKVRNRQRKSTGVKWEL